MNYKEKVVAAGVKMLRDGLTVETWGNISIKDPETGYIYITPSGMDYEACTPEDMVVFDQAGNLIEGHRKPTIETKMHLAIYHAREDVKAVIHTHPIHSLVFACLKKDIPLLIDEAAQCMGDTVRVADYGLPGTVELANNCVKALGNKSKACLLQSHGAICVGTTIEEAFKVAKVLELTAQVYHQTLAIGEPILLSQANIEAMQEFVKTKYGQ